MMDADLLKQLENSLISYQENQETLDIVVQSAQRAFGDDWIKSLPQAFDDSTMDEKTKALLRDKANHAIHYYSALLAWQEAYSYLNEPDSVTAENLEERIPVLEYWLSLFGNEGAELTQKVKDLYIEKAAKEAKQKEVSVEDSASKTDGPVEEEIVEDTIKEKIEEPEEIKPISDVQDEIIEEKPAKQELQEEKTLEETTIKEKEPEENPIEETPDTTEAIEEISGEIKELIKEEPTEIVEEVDRASEETQTEKIPVLQEQEVEDLPVLKEITKESEEETDQTEKTVEWEDKNTDGEVALEDWIDLDSIPTAEPPVSPIREPKEAEKDPQFVSLNWDITAYLKQKELFDAANNWLSAWCVRMDNAEKTSYPHYGFIVDLMHDLKEKAQIVLENQLLEDSVEQDVPDGRIGMEKVVEAIDKELETLPDNFKTSTAEKIKLNAREILGKIDTSTAREEIEKAPDGFELIDDPYETSTQQIIDDFEKTEREAQNKIDQLNVMEDDKNN